MFYNFCVLCFCILFDDLLLLVGIRIRIRILILILMLLLILIRILILILIKYPLTPYNTIYIPKHTPNIPTNEKLRRKQHPRQAGVLSAPCAFHLCSYLGCVWGYMWGYMGLYKDNIIISRQYPVKIPSNIRKAYQTNLVICTMDRYRQKTILVFTKGTPNQF